MTTAMSGLRSARHRQLRLGQAEQMVAGAAAPVHSVRVQQGTDLMHGSGHLPMRPAIDGDVSTGRLIQAQDQPHGGRFAGAVRAEKTGHLSGRIVKLRSLTARLQP